MTIKYSVMELEGTPGELSTLTNFSEQSNPPTAGEDPELRFVNPEECLAILNQPSLSTAIRAVITELTRANGAAVTAERLREVAGYTDARASLRFGGMLSTFNRRVMKIAGPRVRFFEVRWNREIGASEWRLPESSRQAILGSGSLLVQTAGVT